MFIFVGISPLVLIVIVIMLLSHIVITGPMILAALGVAGVSLIITAGIVSYMTTRMRVNIGQAVSYAAYVEKLESEPVETTERHLRAIRATPIESVDPLQPPAEVHNHIHLDGLDPEQVAAYLQQVGKE